MSLPDIPKKLEDWKIETIDGLLDKTFIENEDFDFKGSKIQEKNNELYNDICAMANSVNDGIIVLGVGEKKNPKTEFLLGFVKEGFPNGDEDTINQQIGNNFYNVEPLPKFGTQIVSDNNNKFYVVVRVVGEEINKPYFIKGSTKCYVRVGNSSKPASRTIILNLLSNYKERQVSLKNLSVCVHHLKESIRFTTEGMNDVDPDSIMKVRPLDLTMMKEAVQSTNWFLLEKDLLGGHTGDYGFQGGWYSHLNDLECLNLYVNAYNNDSDPNERKKIKRFIVEGQFWGPGRDKSKTTLLFLERINTEISKYLSSH